MKVRLNKRTIDEVTCEGPGGCTPGTPSYRLRRPPVPERAQVLRRLLLEPQPPAGLRSTPPRLGARVPLRIDRPFKLGGLGDRLDMAHELGSGDDLLAADRGW